MARARKALRRKSGAVGAFVLTSIFKSVRNALIARLFAIFAFGRGRALSQRPGVLLGFPPQVRMAAIC